MCLVETLNKYGFHMTMNEDGDTQLYISSTDKLSNAMNILSQCLEAVRSGGETAPNRLQLNPGKIEQL